MHEFISTKPERNIYQHRLMSSDIFLQTVLSTFEDSEQRKLVNIVDLTICSSMNVNECQSEQGR